MYTVFQRVYMVPYRNLGQEVPPVDDSDIVVKPKPPVIDERNVFRNGLINLTVHLLTFLFSLLAIPISVVTIVIASLKIDYLATLGETTKQFIGLLLLFTGAVDMLMIVFPYITSATIVKHFLT